jgi:hypothetical protein
MVGRGRPNGLRNATSEYDWGEYSLETGNGQSPQQPVKTRTLMPSHAVRAVLARSLLFS